MQAFQISHTLFGLQAQKREQRIVMSHFKNSAIPLQFLLVFVECELCKAKVMALGGGQDLNPIQKLFALFPEAKNDGIFFGWSHASNTRQQVTSAAADSSIHLLESDVRLVDGRPVMQHDPDKPYDLTLFDYINILLLQRGRKKGIKLDLKDLGSVQQGLPFLGDMPQIEKLPLLMLNADILPGPGPQDQLPTVDGVQFVSLAMHYVPKWPLSVGWMVHTLTPKDPMAKYTNHMLQQMHGLTKELDVPVTFPIRASYVHKSIEELKWLLDQKDTYSLTMWHNRNDVVDEDYVMGLRVIRGTVSKHRIFYDLPKELIDLITSSRKFCDKWIFGEGS